MLVVFNSSAHILFNISISSTQYYKNPTMNKYLTLLAFASALILPATSHPLQSTDAALRTRSILSKRGEPTTGDDLPDIEPHPSQLDQVETAFADAILLAQHAYENIDKDTTIFPNYFALRSRNGVKKVFSAIIGSSSLLGNYDGSEQLGNIHVQTTDSSGLCSSGTLAYTTDDTVGQHIVLCPDAFKKKAIGKLNGADPSKSSDARHFIDCDTLTQNGHVSYLMNALGATLLHEYTHYDELTKHIFQAKPIVDQDDGYGPYNVYGRLNKNTQAYLNADSYMYYAVHSYFADKCGFDFQAPRSGTDDVDPDCGGTVCAS